MGHSLETVARQERTRREILHRSDHIPPLPENATRLLSLLDKPDTEPEDMEALVRKDQVLVAKLLRMVNSPLYGLSREMSSIRDATMVIGFRGLRSLVLASCTAQHLKRDYSVFGFEGDGLWSHSLAVAVVSRKLARLAGLSPDKQEEMFIVGLLHDIGKLVLVSYLSGSRKVRPEGELMRDWEVKLCGVDHAEAGAIVSERWQLHKNITTLLASHHSDAVEAEMPRELAILRVADGFAHSHRMGFNANHQPECRVEDADLDTLCLKDVWGELNGDLEIDVKAAITEMASM